MNKDIKPLPIDNTYIHSKVSVISEPSNNIDDIIRLVSNHYGLKNSPNYSSNYKRRISEAPKQI